MLKNIALFFVIGIFLIGCTGDGTASDCVVNPLANGLCLSPNPPLPIDALEIGIQDETGLHQEDKTIKVGEHIDFKARARYNDGYWYDVTSKVDWVTLSNNPAYRWDNSVNGRLIGVHQGSLLPIQIKFESSISNEVIVNIGD